MKEKKGCQKNEEGDVLKLNKEKVIKKREVLTIKRQDNKSETKKNGAGMFETVFSQARHHSGSSPSFP